MVGARLDTVSADGKPALAGGDRAAADAVVLCIGAAARDFQPLARLPLRAIRGQVTECAATPASMAWSRAICHTGYLTPAVDGVHLIGATFDPHDPDGTPRTADDAANAEQLRRHLPTHWRELGGASLSVTGHRAGFRCQAVDFLPLVGRTDDPAATLVNVAHGSRGLTGTPLAAEQLADAVTGLPAAVDVAITDAPDPRRFARRAARRRR